VLFQWEDIPQNCPFTEFGFKIPIHATQMEVFLGICLLNCSNVIATPEGTSLHRRGWTNSSDTWFLEPIPANNPKGISIGSAVFCRAHYNDRPTDSQRYLVCNKRPHLRSTAMRPNNMCILSCHEVVTSEAMAAHRSYVIITEYWLIL